VNELIWLIAEHRAEHNGRRMGRVGKRRTDCNTEKSGKTNLQSCEEQFAPFRRIFNEFNGVSADNKVFNSA
jgi:hypothetical protein